eukprot:4339304-Pleurochrysis_carterae.AAC.1
MGFDLNHDPPRYHSISLGDCGNNGFKKYATMEGDSSLSWKQRKSERNGGPVLCPPHNGNKIWRPTSGFGRFLIFRDLSVRPEVAD